MFQYQHKSYFQSETARSCRFRYELVVILLMLSGLALRFDAYEDAE